jgi:hypothetical protein
MLPGTEQIKAGEAALIDHDGLAVDEAGANLKLQLWQLGDVRRDPPRLVRLVQLRLYDQSAKLFDERLSRFQIGKAPTIGAALSSEKDVLDHRRGHVCPSILQREARGINAIGEKQWQDLMI